MDITWEEKQRLYKYIKLEEFGTDITEDQVRIMRTRLGLEHLDLGELEDILEDEGVIMKESSEKHLKMTF